MPTRRQFLGYILAGSTLAVAVPEEAARAAPLPGGPQPAEVYDASDLLRDTTSPPAHLLSITISPDGTAVLDLPRAEVGQGITTAAAMIVAEELDLPVGKVRVTLADARPELGFTQWTGYSMSVMTLYEPLRVAAGLARARLAAAASARWGVPVAGLVLRDGVVTAPGGLRAEYGSLAAEAAAATARVEEVEGLEPPAARGTVVGRPQGRIDALAAVTGRKQFAMDLHIPGALPTMVCRPPTLRGTVRSVRNLAEVARLPGVTDVAAISTGVAVRARTFGQCIDAVRALRVDWGPGPVDHESTATVAARLRAAELPMPPAPTGARVVDHRFTFNFRSGSPLETNCAVADVRPDSAEVWSCLQMPIVVRQRLAQRLGLPIDAVRVHVVEGGGSFGRRVYCDAAYEAAEASQAFGKPVRLMWHRTDDVRHGRMHPMATSRVRASVLGGGVASFDQRHTAVAMDATFGFGEIASVTMTEHGGNAGLAQTAFSFSTAVPYDFGSTTRLLAEAYAYDDFPTATVRNVYTPDLLTATELTVDQLARVMRLDPVEFRRAFLKDDPRLRAVLDSAAAVGRWGRAMTPGTAQGIAIVGEHKSRVACLVEIDARPRTAGRKVRDGRTGPRVTKVVMSVDVGLPVNPRGLQAQLLGGAMDGIAQALTAGVHIADGLPLEASWDDYHYTRQWNVPYEFTCVVMPPTADRPGGAGELGVGVTQAAVACAYARATGTLPTEFPIDFHAPLGFPVKPRTPPIPQSPVDGLRFAH